MEIFSERFETPAERFLKHTENNNLSPEKVDEVLRSIEELLFRIVEMTGDLDPQVRKQLRQQLKNLLQELGLNQIQDITVVYSFLSGKAKDRIEPDWYPTIDDFKDEIRKLIKDNNKSSEPISNSVHASDLARNAQIDRALQGRGGLSLEEYLYNLGLFMVNSYAYSIMIPDSDAIAILKDWVIENGRHRTFVLKIFGEEDVKKVGMDGWIKVKDKSNLKAKIKNSFKN